jgi:hypothetical protein
MNYTFKWQPNSQITYFQETDFILLKWNTFEVKKFDELVEENLFRLSLNPLIGTFNKNLKLFALVISKQTTLYYNFDENAKIIDLYVFWNNSKNPNDLAKLL